MRLPLTFLLILILPASASGHGGGLDTAGGHNNNTTTPPTYHCHTDACVGHLGGGGSDSGNSRSGKVVEVCRA